MCDAAVVRSFDLVGSGDATSGKIRVGIRAMGIGKDG